MSYNESPSQLLEKWIRILTYSAKAHVMEASRLKSRDLCIGIPAAIVGLSGGAGSLAGIGVENFEVALLGAIVAVCGNILNGIQNVTKFSQLSRDHLSAGRQLIFLIRRVEQVLSTINLEEDTTMRAYVIEDIRHDMETIQSDAPGISNVAHRKAVRKVDSGEGV